MKYFLKIILRSKFVVAIHIFVLTLLYNNYVMKTNPLCISLIIPATIEDYLRCKNTLINSVCSSLKYPQEIVLIISGIYNNSIINYVNINMSNLKKCTNQLIVSYRKRKYNAASNRNMGYRLSHCSIISFFDIDDIMSSNRIYVLHKIFEENKKIDIVFHSSTNHIHNLDNQNISKYYKMNVVLNQHNIITNHCKKTFTFDNKIHKCDVSNGYYITNGWPTLKRNIMNSIRFNESLYSTEDLDFISKIVRCGYKVALYKRPLGYYVKDSKCDI